MAGIESLVQDKRAPFMGETPQTEQPFQLNPQLVDLLALQKMKSQREAAARDIQLKMAAQMGTPPTIKQQRETELFDHTRNEIAQQAGATGQQQAAELQARMQALAGGGGGNQGIAGFARGGEVGWDDPQMAGTRSGSALKALSEWWKRQNERARRYKETGSVEEPEHQVMGTGPLPEEPSALDSLYSNTPPAEMQSVDIDTIINAQPQMPRTRVQDTDVAPPQEMPYEKEYSEFIRSRLDPNFSRNRAEEERGIASEWLDTSGRQAQLKEQQDQLAALDARQLDPKKLARQRLAAFLIAAGRGRNLGSGLGLGGGASAQLRGEQEGAERSRLIERQGIADKIAGLEQESRAGIYGAGLSSQNATANQVATAANAVAEERRGQLNAQQQELDRRQEVELENNRVAALRSLEEFKAGVSGKENAVRAYASLQANYDARLQAIIEQARMFQLPQESVAAELELLDGQYGELLDQLRSELGVGGESDGGFTVRRVE